MLACEQGSGGHLSCILEVYSGVGGGDDGGGVSRWRCAAVVAPSGVAGGGWRLMLGGVASFKAAARVCRKL